MPYYGTTPTTQNTDHTILTGRAEPNQHPANAVTVNTVQLTGIIGGSIASVQTVLENLVELNNREIISLKAGKNLSAYRVVMYTGDDIVEYADHENPAQMNRLAGVTLNAVQAGAQVKVCADGAVKFDGWHFSPGMPVFVAKNGELTQQPPTTGLLQHIGFAIAIDTFLVRFDTPLIRS